MNVGLFEVVPDAVYQVRGMDLSDISFLEDPPAPRARSWWSTR
ncbi:hypothetical protein NKH77_17670 [Streptomyces sp. M19]